MRRRVRYRLEDAAFVTLMAAFRALSLDNASDLGEWLGERIGLRLHGMSRVARVNLAIAFPNKSEKERETILQAMWKHLGRMASEMAHISGTEIISRISFEGLHHLPPPGKAALFVSGHFGNWELAYSTAYEHGVPVTLIYRHLNNPLIDRRLARIRAAHASGMFPKGVRGAARMAKALRNGESMALLIDQKMNEGIAVPFFGRPAMTAPAVAELALKFGLPIIPARCVRLNGAHFRVTVFPPLAVTKEDNAAGILMRLNAMLEEWIRANPEQWFWVHRRWEKSLYSTSASASPS